MTETAVTSDTSSTQRLTGALVILLCLVLSAYFVYRWYDRDNLHPTVVSLRFFESDQGIPAEENRVYASQFLSAYSRYINWELHLALGKESSTFIPFPMKAVWSGPPGAELPNDTPIFSITPHETDQRFAAGWGSVRPGTFLPGHYAVDIFVDEKRFAHGTFDVIP